MSIDRFMDQKELPTGWTKARLLDVVEPRGERVPPNDFPQFQFIGMDHVEAHTTKIIGSIPANTMKSSASRFYSGDVLYGRLRPYLNKVTRPNFEGLASAEFIVFPDNDLVKSEFLMYRLNARDFVSFASHLNEGDRPRVNFNQIGDFEILIPPPNEQKRIVAKIEALFAELDAGVASLKTAQAQLKTYRQALLKHAFTGKLTEQWRAENAGRLEDGSTLLQRIRAERQARHEAALATWAANGRQGQKPRPPKDLPPLTPAELEELPQLPAGWAWVKFDELIESIRGGTTAVPQDLPTNFPILRSSSVRAGKIDYSDVRYLIEEQKKDHNDFVNPGNLLFTRLNGTIDYVGNCAVVGSIFPENLMYPDRLYRAKLINMERGKFYELVFSSPYVRRKIEKTAKSSAGHRRISISDITNLPVPLISLSEGRQIVNQIESKFSVIDQLEQTITTGLQQAEALRQSILKKAFSGQLVPQDPADEPAAVLLARIRAAKP